MLTKHAALAVSRFPQEEHGSKKESVSSLPYGEQQHEQSKGWMAGTVSLCEERNLGSGVACGEWCAHPPNLMGMAVPALLRTVAGCNAAQSYHISQISHKPGMCLLCEVFSFHHPSIVWANSGVNKENIHVSWTPPVASRGQLFLWTLPTSESVPRQDRVYAQ